MAHPSGLRCMAIRILMEDPSSLGLPILPDLPWCAPPPGSRAGGLDRQLHRTTVKGSKVTTSKRDTQRTPAKKAQVDTFTPEERAAMKEMVAERKAAARRSAAGGDAEAEADVLAKIAAMPAGDRQIAERIHAIIKASAPGLSPRTWYG